MHIIVVALLETDYRIGFYVSIPAKYVSVIENRKVKMAGSWNRDTCCGCRKPIYHHRDVFYYQVVFGIGLFPEGQNNPHIAY
ncbi:hypothetical protein Hanom_Chr02g00124841 [Helianthus anomalus]